MVAGGRPPAPVIKRTRTPQRASTRRATPRGIQGATSGCADTASVQITVLPSPTAQFTLDQDAACNALTTDPRTPR